MKKDYYLRFISIVFTISWLYVWGLALFGEKYRRFVFALSNTALFLTAILIIGIFLILIGVCDKRNVFAEKRLPRLLRGKHTILIVSFVILIMQLGITYCISFWTSWDVGAVWYGSKYVAEHDLGGLADMSEYFSIYPNNLFLVRIFSFVLKLNNRLGTVISNGTILLGLFQCVLINLTGIVLFDVCKKMYSEIHAWFAFFLYTILIGFSSWIVIPYSDSTGIIFVILTYAFYYYLRNTSQEHLVKKIFFSIAMGCTSIIGFYIKPTVAIVIIAVIVVHIFDNKSLKNADIKRGIVQFVSFILAAVITYSVVNYSNNQLGFSIDDSRQLGLTHHLMIGANVDSRGGYSDADLEFSSRKMDREVRQKEEIEVTIQRYKEMGISGYSELFALKASKNFLDGTWGWGGGTSFYGEKYPSRGRIADLLRSWYYDDDEGRYYFINAVSRQIIWLVMICLFPFAVVSKKKLTHEEEVLITSILGLMLYLQIFEAHPRYVFVYVPLLCIVAVKGFTNLFELANSLIDRFSFQKQDKE